MKKKLFSIIAILFCTIILVSCKLYGNEKYTITFEENGGSVVEDIILEWGDEINLPTCTREGYTFQGWYIDQGLTATYGETTLTENITLYAKWTVNSYDITFNANGGKFSDTSTSVTYTYTYDETFNIEKPAKEGYSFVGWYTNESLNTSYGSKVKAGNTTLYAKYIVNTYEVSFDKNSSDATGQMDKASVVFGESVDLSECSFGRTGYTFKGWSTEPNGEVLYQNRGSYTQNVGSNVTLYAIWKAKDVEVSYLSFGLEIASKNTLFNSLVDLSIQASKNGYTFKGWATEFKETTDTEVNKSKLYYVLNGENYELVTISQFEQNKKYYELNTVSEAKVQSLAFTLYAVYERNLNTIEFTTNGGSNIETINLYTGYSLTTLSSPTKDGYTFAGWYKDASFTSGLVSTISSIENSMVLFAKWDANEYQVSFNSKYSNEQMNTVTAKYDESFNLPASTFTRVGYNFKGWSLTDNGEKIYDDQAQVLNLAKSGSTTLYALWEAKGDTPYKVHHSFEQLDGSYLVDKTLDDLLTGTTLAYTNASYKDITGFTKEKESVDQVEIKADGTTEITLKYTRNSYTVSYKEGETIKSTSTVKYNAQIGSYPASLKKTGYTLSLTIDGNNYSSEYIIKNETIILVSYSANSYEISFDGVVTAIEKKTVEFDSLVELPTPIKTGYTFAGWKYNDELVELSENKYKVVEAKNIVLTATWTPAKVNYTVKYEFESVNDSTVFVEDSTIQAFEVFEGTTESLTDVSYKTIEHFTASTDSITQKTIAADGSTVIILKYTRNSYTVSYKEGETEKASVSVKYNSQIGVYPESLNQNGYILTLTIDSNSYDTTYVVVCDLIVTVSYTPNEYAITYHNCSEPQLASYYGAEVTLPVPTKTGYSFAGWSLTDGGEKAYDGSDTIIVSEALDLYALWTPIEVNYTIKYLFESVGDSSSFIEDSTIQAAETKQGYTESNTNVEYKSIEHFTASTEPITQKTIAADGSTVIILKYTRNSYTVSYKEGEAELATKNLKYQTQIGEYPASLAKNGYTYSGTILENAYSQEYTISGDTVVVITYTANQYTISFDDTTVDSMNVLYDSLVTLPTPTKTGYTFTGWKYNDESVELSENKYKVSITDNITLNASWSANTYTIKFVTGSENITFSDISATYDVEYTIPNVNNNPDITIEYIFKSWKLGDGSFSEGQSVKNLSSENGSIVTLIAEWEVAKANPRTITFYDESNNVIAIRVQYDLEIVNVPSALIKAGYDFDYWKNKATNERLINGETYVNGDAVYVAVYKVATYTYEFKGYYTEESSELQNTSLTDLAYNSSITAPQAIAHNGAIFVGWYSDAELTIAVVVDQYATRNMTYYAKYVEPEASYSFLSKKNGSIIYSTNTDITDEDTEARAVFIDEYVQDLYKKLSAFNSIDTAVGNAIAGSTDDFESITTYFATLSGGVLQAYSTIATQLGTSLGRTPTHEEIVNAATQYVKANLASTYGVLTSIDHEITALDVAFAYAMASDEQKSGLLTGLKLFLQNEIPSTYLSQIFDSNGNFTNSLIPSIIAAYSSYKVPGTDTIINKIKNSSGADDNTWESAHKTTVTNFVTLLSQVYPINNIDIVDEIYFAAAQQNQAAFEELLSFNYTQKNFYNSLYNEYKSNGYNPVREGYVFDGWIVEGSFAYPNWRKKYEEVDQVQIIGTGSEITLNWHHDDATTFTVISSSGSVGDITGSNGNYQVTISNIPNGKEITVIIKAIQSQTNSYSYTLFEGGGAQTIASIQLSSDGSNEYKYKYYNPMAVDISNKADWYYVGDIDQEKVFYFYQQHEYNFGSSIKGLLLSDSKFGEVNGSTLSTNTYLGTFTMTITYKDNSTLDVTCNILPLVSDIELGTSIKEYQTTVRKASTNSEYLAQEKGEEIEPYYIGVLSYSYISSNYSDYSYVYKDSKNVSWPLYNGFTFAPIAKVRNNASGIKSLTHSAFNFSYKFYSSTDQISWSELSDDFAIHDVVNDVFYFNKNADQSLFYKVVISYSTESGNIYVPEAYKTSNMKESMQKEFIFKLNSGVNVFTHTGLSEAYSDIDVTSINIHSTIEAELELSKIAYKGASFVSEFFNEDNALTCGELDLEDIVMLKKATDASKVDYSYGPYSWNRCADQSSKTSDQYIQDINGVWYEFADNNLGDYVICKATMVENYTSGKFKIVFQNPTSNEFNVNSHHYKPASIYIREYNTSTNKNLTINGNYFTIDGSKLPYWTSNTVVQLGSIKNASGYTIYSSGGSIFSYDSNASLIMKNITILSNFISYDEFSKSSSKGEDEIETVATYMTRTSGSWNAILARGAFGCDEKDTNGDYTGSEPKDANGNGTITKIVLYNVNIYNSLIALFPTSNASAECNYFHTDNNWSNSIYGYGTKKVTLINSEIGQSGGAAIHLEDVHLIDAEIGTSVNPELVVDEYTLDHINNYITGGEQWFVAYSMSSSAIGLKKVLAAVSGNAIIKTGTEKMNLVFMSKNTGTIDDTKSQFIDHGKSYNSEDYVNTTITVTTDEGDSSSNLRISHSGTSTDSQNGVDVYYDAESGRAIYYISASNCDAYQYLDGFGVNADVAGNIVYAYISNANTDDN